MPMSFKALLPHKDNSFSKSMPKKQENPLNSLDTWEEIKMQNMKKYSKLDRWKKLRSEKLGLNLAHRSCERKWLNGRIYKQLYRFAARKAKSSGSVDQILEMGEKPPQRVGVVAKTNDETKADEKFLGSSSTCSNEQRMALDAEKKVCLHNGESSHESCSLSSEDGKKCETGHCMETVDECAKDMNCLESQVRTYCAICMHSENLMVCCGKGCGKSFHLSCIDPTLTCAPPGSWHCDSCTRKKIESGVYSVSEGIECILDAREVVLDEKVLKQKEYLVKYKSLAHVHNRWIPQTHLRNEAPMLISKYRKRLGWKAEWSVPHRLLKRRSLMLLECSDHDSHRIGDVGPDCHSEWLVKWTGLNYDHATWELEKFLFLQTPEAVMLMKNYESRHQNYEDPHSSKEGSVEVSEFLSKVSFELCESQLPYVKKLHDYWHRRQNAIIFDYQDRFVKVVLFILSLVGSVSQPFLVIASSNTLSLWEYEFSHWSTVANVVTYQGSRDVRAIIRTLEFYTEDGRIMFQVLLSSSDVIVEDLEMFEMIKWATIVIDECQRHLVSVHSKQFKMLAADMKLLIVSSEQMDRRFDYENALALLDSTYDAIDCGEKDPDIDTCSLKERLAQFTAFECRIQTSKFKEYWVPAHLSRMQMEQYCASLIRNRTLLSSVSRSNSADSFCEILNLSRKCCDHPYFVDPSLRTSSTADLSVDPLDAEINVSGKLQLLDMILREIKQRGLRVLILFQSLIGLGNISIGDILDDLVHQRYGQDSYSRIQADIAKSKKQAALNSFNSSNSGRFVCLMDYRACVPSIKLSSVDIVILFDSDWNPLNDLRALHKITIDSKFGQTRVLRLYSCFTVEESILILAKEGITLESPHMNTSQRTCHMLLSWGASYLFKKLRDYTNSGTPISGSEISHGRSLLDDVIYEFSALLADKNDNTDTVKFSTILNVQLTEGAYSRRISLRGEVESQSMDSSAVDKKLLEDEPHVFWANLLEGSHPRCNDLSRPSRRVSKEVQMSDGCLEGSESVDWLGEPNSDNAAEKCLKVVNIGIFPHSETENIRKKRKARTAINGCGSAGTSGSLLGKRVKCLPRLYHSVKDLNCASGPRNVPVQCNEQVGVASSEHVLEVEMRNEGTWTNEEMPNNDSTHLQNEGCIRSNENMYNIRRAGVMQSEGCTGTTGEFPTNSSTVQIQSSTGQGMSSGNHQPARKLSVQRSTHVPVAGADGGEGSNNFRTTNSLQDTQDNVHPETSSLTSLVLYSSSTDPLQKEMERIQKERDKATTLHKEMKMKLLSDCEQEISEIRKKYDALIQESETRSLQQMGIFERDYNILHANRLLAAVFANHFHVKSGGEQVIQLAPEGSVNIPTNHPLGGSILKAPAPLQVSRTLSSVSSHHLPTFPNHLMPNPQEPSSFTASSLTWARQPQVQPASNIAAYEQ